MILVLIAVTGILYCGILPSEDAAVYKGVGSLFTQPGNSSECLTLGYIVLFLFSF